MRLATLFIAACALSTGARAGSLSVQVVDKDGKPTADAVVVVVPSAKGVQPGKPLAMNATVVQEKMQFVPPVSVVPLGARVRFVNNDPWDHHVRATAAGAAQFIAGTPPAFELMLEGKTDGKPPRFKEVTMDKPGALGASLLGCFLHGSMRGHVYVSDSPWAAKTNAEGVATFDDLPDGATTVKVWQADQLIDLPPQQTYVANQPVRLKVQLQVVPRRPRVVPTTTYTG